MDYRYSEHDLRIIKQHLQDFLPERIFDAHMHLYDQNFLENYDRKAPWAAKRLGMEDYLTHNKQLYGNRQVRANILIVPDVYMDDKERERFRERSLQFLKTELDKYPQCVGEAAVFPQYSAKDAHDLLVHKNIVGFKPYHTTADLPRTFDADIGEYLSEGVWEAANDKSLCITLHIVKDKALSDEKNLAYITSMCAKYPRAKLILAHCARGFASWTVVEKVAELADYDNIWFDLAAVCEPSAIFQVIKKAGKRTVWGSDYPISMLQGRAVSISDGFHWIGDEDGKRWQGKNFFQLNLVAVEALLAFKQAAHMLELSRKDIADIFYNNALRLFGIK